MRLYEHWDDLPTPEETRSFMYTTAHNLCISRLRHRNVEEEYTRRLLEEQADREDPRLAEEITYQETLRLLRAAIDSLPRQSRQVILLALDGKNNQETATLLGVSVNTVKTLKKGAYAKLRTLLAPLSDEEIFMLLALLAASCLNPS